MRQTATYALPSPWRDIGWQLLLWVAFFIVTCLIDFRCTAHAGQLQTVSSSRPSIRHTRRMTRITVYRPARIQGRIATGRPFLKTTEYLAGTAFYGAKTIYSNSPGGMLGTILTPRWFFR
jgi:hypothetical protein